MEEESEINDIRKILSLITEFRPQVKYFTQYEYQDGYSQTNETSLNLREDNDIDEDMFDEGVEYGEYETGKIIYDDEVYECEISTINIDSFIDLINEYIELNGKDSEFWYSYTFFDWYVENNKETELTFDGTEQTIGYESMKNHDITWCIGYNNFSYHGIHINDIKTGNKTISFSRIFDDNIH